MTTIKSSFKLIMILLVCSHATFAQKAKNNMIIISPVNGSSVPQYSNMINFKSNSPVSATLMPVVFIKDPIGQWWPWLSATNTNNTRINWQLSDVQFGVDKDRDLSFIIQILVIPQSSIDNGIETKDDPLFIEAGTPIKNTTMVTVLRKKFPTQSNIVTVVRQ